jgi:hypothetical protein
MVRSIKKRQGAPELDPGAARRRVDQKKNWTLTCELNGCCTAPPLP